MPDIERASGKTNSTDAIYEALSGFGRWFSVPFASTEGWHSHGDCPSVQAAPDPIVQRGCLPEVQEQTSRQGFWKRGLGNQSFHSRLFSLYSMKHSVQKPLFSGVPKYMQPAFLHLLVPVLSPGVRGA